MGKLLALSLACTMMAAVFFQPLLMGPPREDAKPKQPHASSPDAPPAGGMRT